MQQPAQSGSPPSANPLSITPLSIHNPSITPLGTLFGVDSWRYVAAEGYRSHGDSNELHIVFAVTYTQGKGRASALGTNIISAGLNIHVPDSLYDVDYLFMIYVHRQSDGYANVGWTVYSACAGIGFKCGPDYGNCNNTNCPIADKKLGDGVVSQVGKYGDPVGVSIGWNTKVAGFVMDYQDTNNNPSWWTYEDFLPGGNDITMLQYLHFGDANTYCTTNPVVCKAYHFQVGLVASDVPTNTNWRLDDYNTQYIVQGTSNNVFMDHALTLTWAYKYPYGYDYYSFWMEEWTVSDNPAQGPGYIHVYGSGSSTSNDIYMVYDNSGQQGGNVQLW